MTGRKKTRYRRSRRNGEAASSSSTILVPDSEMGGDLPTDEEVKDESRTSPEASQTYRLSSAPSYDSDEDFVEPNDDEQTQEPEAPSSDPVSPARETKRRGVQLPISATLQQIAREDVRMPNFDLAEELKFGLRSVAYAVYLDERYCGRSVGTNMEELKFLKIAMILLETMPHKLVKTLVSGSLPHAVVTLKDEELLAMYNVKDPLQWPQCLNLYTATSLLRMIVCGASE